MDLRQILPFLLLMSDPQTKHPTYVQEKFDLFMNYERPWVFLDRHNLAKLYSYLKSWRKEDIFPPDELAEIQKRMINAYEED